jgi:malonate transporter and related proteins
MAAFQNGAAHGHHQKGALFARQLRAFFDTIKRHLRGPAKNTEHRNVFQTINGVVAPIARGNKLAVNAENAGQFRTGEGDGFGPGATLWNGGNNAHKASFARLTLMSKAKTAICRLTLHPMGEIFLNIALIDPCIRLIPGPLSVGRTGALVGISGFNHRPQPPGDQARRLFGAFIRPLRLTKSANGSTDGAIMNAVFSIALPVFAIIAAGLIAGRMKLMSASDSDALNKFVFRFAMPAALFGLTAGTAPPGPQDLTIALSYGAAAFTAIFGGYFLARTLFPVSKSEAGAHGFASTLGNAVFLGLPIALTVDGWARPFVTLMLIEGVFVIALGAALMAPRRDGGPRLNRIAQYFTGPARNPLVAAMAAGFIYSALGFSFSGPAETFFSIFGRAAGPTALFSLGLFLATHKFPAIKAVAGRVTAIALVKMALLPAIALSMAMMLGLNDPNYRGALALFVFVPSGVGSFIMASQYGVYKSETAAAVSLTTLLSVLTISGVLIVFG